MSGEGRDEAFRRCSSAMRSGDRSAAERLWESIYSDLFHLAERQSRRNHPPQGLQPAALVNECYLRLAAAPEKLWDDRPHFMAAAASAMRHIAVDRARKQDTGKRGGGFHRVEFEEPADPAGNHSVDTLALDEALKKLSRLHPRQERVLLLRYFCGLDVEQTAKALGVSTRTVKRDWAAARRWLRARLGDH